MKTPSPFWPLLKNELALGRHGGPFQMWMLVALNFALVGIFPILILFGHETANGVLEGAFAIAGLCAPLFFCAASTWICIATVPAVREILSYSGNPAATVHVGAFEYLFTRPVDRRVLLRAKTSAVGLLFLSPLFVDIAVALFLPDPRLDARPLPSGTLLYTGWMTCTATLGVFLLQAYAVLAARWVKPSLFWTILLAIAPLLVGLPMIFVVENHLNFVRVTFDFFTRHPVVIILAVTGLGLMLQNWSEKRFSKLELP